MEQAKPTNRWQKSVTSLSHIYCQTGAKMTVRSHQTIVRLSLSCGQAICKKSWNNQHDKPFPAVRNIKIDISNINNNFWVAIFSGQNQGQVSQVSRTFCMYLIHCESPPVLFFKEDILLYLLSRDLLMFVCVDWWSRALKRTQRESCTSIIQIYLGRFQIKYSILCLWQCPCKFGKGSRSWIQRGRCRSSNRHSGWMTS